jgi:hypothetical protein
VIDLHDAIIEELRLDYRAGTVLVMFKTAAGRVNLTAEGVFMVRAPRREPWGSSAGVNVVRGPGPVYAEGTAVQVEIEMQSGDVLEIEARSIVISPAA